MTYYSSCPETDDGKKALKMTLRILDAMNNGGIHDHVGQVNLYRFFFYIKDDVFVNLHPISILFCSLFVENSLPGS